MRNKPAQFQFFLQGWGWLTQRFSHKSLQHFLFAVVISAIFHAYFIQAIWHFLNPNPQNQVQNRTIDARLIPRQKREEKILEKVPKKNSAHPIEKEVTKKLEELPPTENEVIPPPVEQVAQTEQVESTQTIDETIQEDSSESTLDVPASDGIAASETAQVLEDGLESSGEADVIENDRTEAYQLIESTFDVFMDAEGKPNRSPAGTATIVYQTFENGEKYQLKNTVTAKGLAALIIPDLLQTSDGVITQQGLQPQHYLYQFGTRKDKSYTADFDWQTNVLTLQNSKGTQTQAFAKGTQDLLSFMYQFMFTPPLNQMQLNITNGKKLRQYDYSFEGEEVLETKLGKINTVHLAHDAVAREEKTELWLATEYRYLPVKIRKTEKDKIYEMLANSIKTDMGVLNPTPPNKE